MEQVSHGSGLALSKVSPARRWGVSGCPGGRTRQGADARPLTIPASGCLRATLRAVPSSFPAADGPSGLAVPGEAVLSPTSCRLFLASAHSSALRTPLANPRLWFLCFLNSLVSSDGWVITPGGGLALGLVTHGCGLTWQVSHGSGLALSKVSPARRWEVSDCLSRRTRQGADARPLTIPASGCLRATLRGAFVIRCGRRTVRTRRPGRGPFFRRRPVGSSWPPLTPQRCGRL